MRDAAGAQTAFPRWQTALVKSANRHAERAHKNERAESTHKLAHKNDRAEIREVPGMLGQINLRNEFMGLTEPPLATDAEHIDACKPSAELWWCTQGSLQRLATSEHRFREADLFG